MSSRRSIANTLPQSYESTEPRGPASVSGRASTKVASDKQRRPIAKWLRGRIPLLRLPFSQGFLGAPCKGLPHSKLYVLMLVLFLYKYYIRTHQLIMRGPLNSAPLKIPMTLSRPARGARGSGARARGPPCSPFLGHQTNAWYNIVQHCIAQSSIAQHSIA